MLRVGVEKKLPWLVFAVILAGGLYAFPFLSNYKFALTNSVHDDNLFGYQVIWNGLKLSSLDFVKYSAPANIYGSLINYGSLWFCQLTKTPLDVVYNGLLLFQLLAGAFLFLSVLHTRLGDFERLSCFIFFLLAGYARWNFSHFGYPSTVYAANVAIPVFWAGLYWFTRNEGAGCALLSLGALIHPSFGLQVVFVAALFCFINPETRFKWKKLLFLLLPAFCATALPSFLLFADHFPRVSNTELLRALCLNSHAAPWDDQAWEFTLPLMISFLLLAALSFSFWKKLGDQYFYLLVSACVGAGVLSLSHIAGHVLKIPQMIQLMGLRSPALIAMLLLPILFLFFDAQLCSGNFGSRFLAGFILLHIVVARPYGLDKAPILLLAASLFFSGRGAGRNYQIIRGVLLFISLAWVALWTYYVWHEPVPFSQAFIDARVKPWSILDYVKANYIIDREPHIALAKKIFVSVSALVLASIPLLDRFKIKWSALAQQILLSIFLLTALLGASLKTSRDLGSQRNQDLYAAGIWAKQNTSRETLFISTDYSWRAFSERSLFYPGPELYFYYRPDSRIKKIDDFMIQLLGLKKAYETGPCKYWYFMKSIAYLQKMNTAENLKKLGKIVGAQYLVESRRFDLPVVYANRTFKIYDLSGSPK